MYSIIVFQNIANADSEAQDNCNNCWHSASKKHKKFTLYVSQPTHKVVPRLWEKDKLTMKRACGKRGEQKCTTVVQQESSRDILYC